MSLTGFDVRDRVIVVTGGGRGIGRVYCERLAAMGASVVVADIDGEGAAGTAAAVAAAGGRALAVPTDVADPGATSAMADRAGETFGRIDVLINNAALMSTLPRGPWHEIPVEDWDRVMAVNLRGMFLCCRAVYPYMRRQRGGKIINISSGRIWEGTPNRLHYTTSKAGVIGFTRALAKEMGEDNICVNAITPGTTVSDSQVASTPEEYLRKAYERRAFRRPQVPDDLIGCVVFLASAASDFMTGQTLNVDGGLAMH